MARVGRSGVLHVFQEGQVRAMSKVTHVIVRFDDDSLIEAVAENAEKIYDGAPKEAFFLLKQPE